MFRPDFSVVARALSHTLSLSSTQADERLPDRLRRLRVSLDREPQLGMDSLENSENSENGSYEI